MKVDEAFFNCNEILGDIIGEICAYTAAEVQPAQIDLTDAKSVFGKGGIVRYGFGTSLIGELPLGLAGKRAAESQLLPKGILKQTNAMIVTITGNSDLTFDEVRSSLKAVQESMPGDAQISCSITDDATVKDAVRVSIFAPEQKMSQMPNNPFHSNGGHNAC